MPLCPVCSQENETGSLVCSECNSLLYKAELQTLYSEYKSAFTAQDWDTCIKKLNACLELLPPNTTQYNSLQQELHQAAHYYNNQAPQADPGSLAENGQISVEKEKLSDIQQRLMKPFHPNNESSYISNILFNTVSKFIFIVTLFASSCLMLLIGFTKPRTLISIIIWVVCFYFLAGWEMAIGLAVMIYFHEMGHLLAIQYFGYRFAWPFFIPFLGAYVLIGKNSKKAYENAVIAFAGPFAGALVSLIGIITMLYYPLPKSISKLIFLNVIINYINLLPFWILDGSRIADSCKRKQILITTIILAISLIISFNAFSVILAGGFLLRFALDNELKKKSHIKCSDYSYMEYVLAANVILLVSFSLMIDFLQPFIRD